MNKSDYLKKACAAKAYTQLSWLISVLAKTYEAPEEWRKNPYPYRLVQTPSGVYFVDPENNAELTKIEGQFGSEAPFSINNKVYLKKDEFYGIAEDFVDSLGNFIANQVFVTHALEGRIKYQRGNWRPGKAFAKNLPLFVDGVPPEQEQPDKLYPRHLIALNQATTFMKQLNKIVVWAATEKSLTTHPDAMRVKKELWASPQYKGRENDPVAIAEVQAILQALDAQWLKGDKSENFYLSAKSRKIVRTRRFLMHGAELGLNQDKTRVDLIIRCLEEGWDWDNLHLLINNFRAGSYNRGAETVLGGVVVKEIDRATNNLKVAPHACESILGIPRLVDENTIAGLVGRSIIVKNQALYIATPDMLDPFKGQLVRLRSPQFCWSPGLTYCPTCLGSRLAENPYGLSVACSDIGSTFLYIYMKAGHGKELATQDFNLEDVLF